MPLQPATLTLCTDGTPFSETYDDVYYSALGGQEQARYVFLGGNDLPARWQGRERFVILETGFGLGLNFLTTWAAWAEDNQRCERLHFLSVEKHPFTAADLATAHAAWPEFAHLAEELRQAWPPLVPGVHRLLLADGKVVLTLIFGDAVDLLRTVEAGVDAFYLDGFSPAKNPEVWSPYLFRALARLAAPGATLATWSVAGTVREGLKNVEFDVEKRRGFANKRQMLVGRYRSRKPARYKLPGERRAIVIGAGIAGSTAAERLAERGWQVTVLEQGAAPGCGASGNIAGVLRPHPSIDDNPLARLTRAGFLTTLQLLRRLGSEVRWAPCGALHLARDDKHAEMQRRTVAALEQPTEFLQFLDQAEASELLSWPVAHGGWYFPGGGWVQPASLCRAALAAYPEQIHLRCNTTVARLEQTANGWQALDADGTVIAEASVVIMASGVAAPRFEQFAWLPQLSARGQVSHLPEAQTPPLQHVVSGAGYATPAVDGIHCAGATHTLDDSEPNERLADHTENLANLDQLLPGYAADIAPEKLTGRVGFRPLSPDRLPIVGPVPRPTALGENARAHQLPTYPGLWCAQGYGARGIVWSALMAELLASQIEGEPLPLEGDLVRAVAPGRFFLRAANKTTID